MSQRPNRVLMVEDSGLIAMEARSSLLELGVSDVALATTVREATALLDGSAFDLAILDYNLAGETSEPLARRLAAQGTPFAIASGDEASADQFNALGAAWVIVKPYSQADLGKVLDWAAELRGG